MAEETTEIDQYLINRVYFMARDGMPMTLYALLSDKTPQQIDLLINQVMFFFVYYIIQYNYSLYSGQYKLTLQLY